jgi:hypothetical protein
MALSFPEIHDVSLLTMKWQQLEPACSSGFNLCWYPSEFAAPGRNDCAAPSVARHSRSKGVSKMKLVPCVAALAAGMLALSACEDDQVAENVYRDTTPSTTYPDQSPSPGVTTPDSTLDTLPPGAVRNPDGTIRYPDGSIRNPDGTLVSPAPGSPTDPVTTPPSITPDTTPSVPPSPPPN